MLMLCEESFVMVEQSGNFYASIVDKFLEPFDEIYQFAADMGGAGFIFTGDNDADIMHKLCVNQLKPIRRTKKVE